MTAIETKMTPNATLADLLDQFTDDQWRKYVYLVSVGRTPKTIEELDAA